MTPAVATACRSLDESVLTAAGATPTEAKAVANARANTIASLTLPIPLPPSGFPCIGRAGNTVRHDAARAVGCVDGPYTTTD
jgi:hypothetical protein